MALALESSSLVQKRVGLWSLGPVARAAFGAFFKDWASNHGNADLQHVPFLGNTADDAGGHDLGIDAAHRVYAFYGKKTATNEDVYLYFFDDATDDAGAGTDGRGQLVFLEASVASGLPTEAFAFYSPGIPMVDGIVIKSYTDFDGVTDSTAGATPNGFVIIGLP